MLAVYISVVSTVAVAASLRLEIAIPIAEADRDAAALMVISFASILLVCFLLMILALTLSEQISGWLAIPAIYKYLWLVPIGVFLLSSYSVTQYWAARFRRFELIARTKVSQAFVGSTVMLASGWLGLAPLGLLIGKSLTEGAGGGVLFRNVIKKDKSLFYGMNLPKLKAVFKENLAYPKYSTVESFANVAGYQMPIVMIASQAGSEAGQLFLAMQVVFIPMTLMGTAVSQVYLSRAPNEMREGRLGIFTKGLMKNLAVVGVPSLFIIGALAPIMFSLVFGSDWGRAGEIVRILLPWVAIQFVVSPVSMALHVTGHQRLAMALQCLGLLLRLGGLYLFVSVGGESVVEMYAGLSACFYALYFMVIIKIVDLKRV
jgi:O-antigen/teichoic acid export membrane protein